MRSVALTGLVKIELPGGTVIRLSDGTAVRWGAETFVQRHAIYGSLASVEAMSEGAGGEVPAMQMVLHPPSTSAAADLVQPGVQKARVRCWIARYLPDSAAVTGSPDLAFDGFLDQARLLRGRGRLELAISVVSQMELLFEANTGNWLSPTFHKSIWPGETGEDEATGLVRQDAWGVEGPSPATNYVWGGGAGGMANGTWAARVAIA